MTSTHNDWSMPIEIKHVPEFSIIRLFDGRIAVSGVTAFKGRKKQYIACLDKGHGIELAADTIVYVVKFPAELAYAWLAENTPASMPA